MNVRQLEIFTAIADELSFTKVAARIGVAQSTVSGSLDRLEADLGARLVERNPRAVQLTDYGRAYLPHARAVVRAAESGLEAIGEISQGLKGTVNVGILQGQAMRSVGLGAVVSEFAGRYPGVTIRFHHVGGSVTIAEHLNAGRLDIGFVAIPGDLLSGLDVTPLATEEMQLIVCRDDPLSTARSVGLAALTKATFVDMPEDWAVRVANDRAFTTAGLQRTIRYEINDSATVIDFVVRGLGIALLPPSLVSDTKGVVAVPIEGPTPSFDISLATSTVRPSSAATVALRQALIAPG